MCHREILLSRVVVVDGRRMRLIAAATAKTITAKPYS